MALEIFFTNLIIIECSSELPNMLTEAENRFFNLVRESACKNRLAVLKSALERTAAGAAKKRRKDSEK